MRVSLAAIREWALLALALFVLNFAVTFHNVWPTWWSTTRYELSVEIAVLLLALTLQARFVGALSPRMLTAVALLLTFMAVGRYAEAQAGRRRRGRDRWLCGRALELAVAYPQVLLAARCAYVLAAGRVHRRRFERHGSRRNCLHRGAARA